MTRIGESIIRVRCIKMENFSYGYKKPVSGFAKQEWRKPNTGRGKVVFLVQTERNGHGIFHPHGFAVMHSRSPFGHGADNADCLGIKVFVDVLDNVNIAN